MIDGLDISQIKDPNNPDINPEYRKNGFYIRTIFLGDIDNLYINISIQRIRPKEKGPTHAILPWFLCPWSRIPVDDLIRIILMALESNIHSSALKNGITPGVVRLIMKKYKDFLKQQCPSVSSSTPESLVSFCLNAFSRTFLQSERIFFGRLLKNGFADG